MAIIFFILFGATLLGMYVAIRRELAPTGMVAALGMIGSVITMTLYLLAQVDEPIQGILFGVLIGVIFAVATLGVAYYFHSHEHATAEAED